MDRLFELQKFCTSYHGRKLMRLLTPRQERELGEFVEKTQALTPQEYDVAVTRLHLDKPIKPSNWTVVEELLRAANK